MSGGLVGRTEEGGVKRNTGRRVVERREVLTLRVTATERRAIEARATLLGLSVSEYLRAAGLGKAGWVPDEVVRRNMVVGKAA